MQVLRQYGGYEASRQFVYQAIALFDEDGSGEISFKEFVEMMTKKPCMSDQVDEIERVVVELFRCSTRLMRMGKDTFRWTI